MSWQPYTSPVTLTVGSRIGPFEITGELGVGGMGEVYRAVDENLGPSVAIKVLPDAFVARLGFIPYDVAPDGQRFFVVRMREVARRTLTVILNWQAANETAISR